MSLELRLQAFKNALFFPLRRRLRWGRRQYRERPVGKLVGLSPEQSARIAALEQRFGLRWPQCFDRANCLENYALLEQCVRAARQFNWTWPRDERVLDVGSKNFYYAAVLHALCAPARLTGVELDGYRIYHDGHTRASYAAHYIAALSGTDYRVQDVCEFAEPINGAFCFYPFVVAEPLIRWGLPASALKPEKILTHVAALIRSGGWLWMTNQFDDEWTIARQILQDAGLQCIGQVQDADCLLPRYTQPWVSAWRKKSATFSPNCR